MEAHRAECESDPRMLAKDMARQRLLIADVILTVVNFVFVLYAVWLFFWPIPTWTKTGSFVVIYKCGFNTWEFIADFKSYPDAFY